MLVDPTPEQADQCAIVQQEMVELVNRLLGEGFDARVVTAGLSAAAAATVRRFHGPREVPIWFAKQSALSYGLLCPED